MFECVSWPVFYEEMCPSWVLAQTLTFARKIRLVDVNNMEGCTSSLSPENYNQQRSEERMKPKTISGLEG